MTNKDYRVTIKVRNNRILRAIEESGGTPGAKWCEANGLTYSAVNDLINMVAGPLNAEGQMRKVALDLCDAVGKLPEELWSTDQIYPLEKNFSVIEMERGQIEALLPYDDKVCELDTSKIDMDETKAAIQNALAKLKPRYRDVMILRYIEDLSLREVGERLDVTPVRVRQMELMALRKLRNPEVSGLLKDCL